MFGLNEFTLTIKSRLAGLLLKYNLQVFPSKENFLQILHSLGKYLTVIQPHYYITTMREVIQESSLDLFSDYTERMFKQFMLLLLPSGYKIVRLLSYNHSDDADSRALEDIVSGFLESYLLGIGQSLAALFLQFVTGLEILPPTIRVEFSGETQEHSWFQ